MKFKQHYVSDAPVSLEEFTDINKAFLALDPTDVVSAEAFLEDLHHLEDNIERFGITEPVMHLIGGTLQEWDICITDKEKCLEGLGETIGKAAHAVFDAIRKFIKKIVTFIAELFGKKRTEAFKQAGAETKDKVNDIIKDDADAKSVINDASEDKAQSAGNVAKPSAEAAAKIEELQSEVNQLKSTMQAMASKSNKLLDEKNALNKEVAALKDEKKDLESAVKAAQAVAKAQEATIGDMKTATAIMQMGINDRARVIRLKLSFCAGLLNAAKELNKSFESMTSNKGWKESVAGVKSLAENKLGPMIPASAIGPAATEISQAIGIMVSTDFKDADAFIDWRDTAFKGCKYLEFNGSSASIKEDIKKESTLGKLGYMKDYLFGELDKKYEGVAAVVNKINTLMKSLDTEAEILAGVLKGLEEIKAKADKK